MIEAPRYLFPNEESMKDSCSYAGYKHDYLCGSMTDKERLLRIVICQLTEIEELCRISHCDPVFSVLQTECAKKLDIALLQYENLDPFCLPASILTITYYKDYTNIPSNLLADTPVLGNQLMQINDKSIASIRTESSKLSDMEKALKKSRRISAITGRRNLQSCRRRLRKCRTNCGKRGRILGSSLNRNRHSSMRRKTAGK